MSEQQKPIPFDEALKWVWSSPPQHKTAAKKKAKKLASAAP